MNYLSVSALKPNRMSFPFLIVAAMALILSA